MTRPAAPEPPQSPGAPGCLRPGHDTLVAALRPWERQLIRESVVTWAVRGATAGLVMCAAVLASSWFTPIPQADLEPIAVETGGAVWVAAILVALWPISHLRRAAALDVRLDFGDRLATAWIYRHSTQLLARLQRDDAIVRLALRSPRADLSWQPHRGEFIALGVALLITLVLLRVPSPQQAIFERRAAEQDAVTAASDRLSQLRVEAARPVADLTPDQANRLDELLRQAQADLRSAHTPRDASAIVARTASQVSQELADPNAALRAEALAAMSETLAAEPLTRALADALQHEDAPATRDAVAALQQQADSLSDVERQALSRALQRASNVGRGEPASSAALGQAANATTTSDEAARNAALSGAEAALRQAIDAARAQATIDATTQRLQDVQAQLSIGAAASRRDGDGSGLLPPNDPSASGGRPEGSLGGTPVALDSAPGSRAYGVRDPSSQPGPGAGQGGATTAAPAAAVNPGLTPAENVFVAGRASSSPTDQDLVDQPFKLRGAPRPYRDVLAQYAQSSRDYVERPDVSPAVRNMVKDYFLKLSEGQ